MWCERSRFCFRGDSKMFQFGWYKSLIANLSVNYQIRDCPIPHQQLKYSLLITFDLINYKKSASQKYKHFYTESTLVSCKCIFPYKYFAMHILRFSHVETFIHLMRMSQSVNDLYANFGRKLHENSVSSSA